MRDAIREALIRRTSARLFLIPILAAAAAGACGGNGTSTTQGTGGDGAGGAKSTSSSSGVGGGGAEIGFGGNPNQGPFADFPADPILDTPEGGAAPPSDSGTIFGAAGSGDPSTGPCLVEPEPGTLFPRNWVRPRFRWTAPPEQSLFELRIKAAKETNELVVYTTGTQWKMPKDMWDKLTTHLEDAPMTVTIRGAQLDQGTIVGQPGLGTSGDITIAPADAAGTIVYWRTVSSSNSGQLKGFSAADENVALALESSQVQVKPGGKSVTCVGCHASTPDGKFAAFKTLNGTSGGALASLEQATTGKPPDYWSMASIDAMNDGQFGVPTFSKGHWQSGDRTLLTSWGNGSSAKLAWFDLEATSSAEGTAFGFLARDQDTRGGIMPNFSHDGQTVLYISTNGSTDGRPTNSDSDLYTIPYANRAGGAAKPVDGAADPAYNEYYPAYAPDDALIAYNRVGAGQNTYDEPSAEVFVIPAGGGTPTRLAANDPIACSGRTSPGVTNSWPKWAPEAVKVGDRTFYWIAFSSKRAGSVPQLYMTAVVTKGSEVQTYPALYMWAQPSDEANHTPAWDVFQIPPTPPPQ
ncbi:Hypothetical protein A7982_12620 [Minicystis rosea]|nr:Hypothetical protein A7982_12620 [Minicystis rosea]